MFSYFREYENYYFANMLGIMPAFNQTCKSAIARGKAAAIHLLPNHYRAAWQKN
jgi:hypothetical protein